jgi:hypothetical protein
MAEQYELQKLEPGLQNELNQLKDILYNKIKSLKVNIEGIVSDNEIKEKEKEISQTDINNMKNILNLNNESLNIDKKEVDQLRLTVGDIKVVLFSIIIQSLFCFLYSLCLIIYLSFISCHVY